LTTGEKPPSITGRETEIDPFEDPFDDAFDDAFEDTFQDSCEEGFDDAFEDLFEEAFEEPFEDVRDNACDDFDDDPRKSVSKAQAIEILETSETMRPVRPRYHAEVVEFQHAPTFWLIFADSVPLVLRLIGRFGVESVGQR